MNSTVRMVVATQNLMYDRLDRMKERSDRGAGFVEYGALVLLVGAILTVLLKDNVIGNAIKDGIKNAIDAVFKQGKPAEG